jgi:proline iminopeptidase
MGDQTDSDGTEAFVTADDGCRLWSISGAAPARSGEPAGGIVFCHGGPGFWDTLKPIADLVADRGRTVRWDQRGGGRSDHQGPYTLARFTADLDAIRAHYGFDQMTLIGHSWGATLALHYALARPDRVTRLVYLAGVGLGWDWRRQHEAGHVAAVAGFPGYAKRISALRSLSELSPAEQRELTVLNFTAEFADPATARLRAEAELTPHFVPDPQVNPTLSAEARTWTEAELVDRCEKLFVPTLILDGKLDLRPRWAVESLAQALPEVTRYTFDRAGHFPWIDRPEEFAQVLRRFVR